MAVGRVKLELMLGPQREMAGHRQRLQAAQRQRPATGDVVLLVEFAQLPLGRARLGGQSPRGCLTASERRLGKRVAPQQVVPVGMCAQQPGHGKARLLEHARQRVELGRVHGRVDQEALIAGAHRRARRLPEVADEDDQVSVESDCSQFTPMSFAASRSEPTSASGFFWPASRTCLERLTQITGIFFLMQGSTSW